MIKSMLNCEHLEEEIFNNGDATFARCENCLTVRRVVYSGYKGLGSYDQPNDYRRTVTGDIYF